MGSHLNEIEDSEAYPLHSPDDEYDEEPVYRSLNTMSIQDGLPFASGLNHFQMPAPKSSVNQTSPPSGNVEFYQEILNPVCDIPMELLLMNVDPELTKKYDDLNEQYTAAPPPLQPKMRRQKAFVPMDFLTDEEQNSINTKMDTFRTQLSTC